jgi:hypothetical protein
MWAIHERVTNGWIEHIKNKDGPEIQGRLYF